MGQKVNPNGLRLGINKDWQAKWYAKGKDFSKNLEKDVKIREYLTENLKNAGIAKVEIERNSKRCEVVIHTSKPGVMIGHGGEEIEKLKTQLSKIADENVQISIVDIKKVDLASNKKGYIIYSDIKIDKSLDKTIDSEDGEYVMQVIREEYLRDSTVTIFIIGTHSSENEGADLSRCSGRYRVYESTAYLLVSGDSRQLAAAKGAVRRRCFDGHGYPLY